MSQTHLAGGALFTAAGLGAATAAGWMHPPAWALALGIAWGALAGELPDIDRRRARVSRTGVAFGVAGRLLVVRIVGMFICGLQVKHRGPTHSLTSLALWAAIAARRRCGGCFAYLAVVYHPYAVVTTALGYVSHLVLDSLTGPIPWAWPFAARRVALIPAALRIRTDSEIETWLLRPVITIAAVIAVLELAGLPSLPLTSNHRWSWVSLGSRLINHLWTRDSVAGSPIQLRHPLLLLARSDSPVCIRKREGLAGEGVGGVACARCSRCPAPNTRCAWFAVNLSGLRTGEVLDSPAVERCCLFDGRGRPLVGFSLTAMQPGCLIVALRDDAASPFTRLGSKLPRVRDALLRFSNALLERLEIERNLVHDPYSSPDGERVIMDIGTCRVPAVRLAAARRFPRAVVPTAAEATDLRERSGKAGVQIVFETARSAGNVGEPAR